MIRKILRMFLVRIDLYCIDLRKNELFKETELKDYSLSILKDVSGLQALRALIAERGEKFGRIAKERWQSGNFLCFCFIEKSTSRAAYSRWLSKDSFYHDRFRGTIRLADDEAFTMDSYTPFEFRGRGLHKEMNRRMLNYCKGELKLKRIFLVILRGSEYSHLHKIVRELGYERIRSRFYFRAGSIKTIVSKLIKSHAEVP